MKIVIVGEPLLQVIDKLLGVCFIDSWNSEILHDPYNTLYFLISKVC